MPEKAATPGRPAAFSRDDAIEGAMNLFWRDGYAGVSASDLAAAMHIQRSSFYNSFGSREAVFLEALEQYSKNAPDKIIDRLRPGDPVLPAIAALFRELCRQPPAAGAFCASRAGSPGAWTTLKTALKYGSLEGEGIPTRVVSLPSWELFQAQDAAWRERVLPGSLTARVSIEAATTFG